MKNIGKISYKSTDLCKCTTDINLDKVKDTMDFLSKYYLWGLEIHSNYIIEHTEEDFYELNRQVGSPRIEVEEDLGYLFETFKINNIKFIRIIRFN